MYQFFREGVSIIYFVACLIIFIVFVTFQSSSVPSTSSNLGNSQCADQPMLDYSTGSVTGQEKVVQYVRCEVCDFVSNNKDLYEKHVGKKRQKTFCR